MERLEDRRVSDCWCGAAEHRRHVRDADVPPRMRMEAPRARARLRTVRAHPPRPPGGFASLRDMTRASGVRRLAVDSQRRARWERWESMRAMMNRTACIPQASSMRTEPSPLLASGRACPESSCNEPEKRIRSGSVKPAGFRFNAGLGTLFPSCRIVCDLAEGACTTPSRIGARRARISAWHGVGARASAGNAVMVGTSRSTPPIAAAGRRRIGRLG